MIYLYIEIYSYKQLLKIYPSIIEKINNRFQKIITEGEISVSKNINGVLLLNFGDEKKIEIKQVLESAFSLLDILKKARTFLHGYNLFISFESTANTAVLMKKIENALFMIKEEEGIWLHKNNFSRLKKVREIGESGEYLCIARSSTGILDEIFLAKIQKIKREDFKKIVSEFSKAKTRPKKSIVTLVKSPQKTLARLLIENALKKLAGKNLFPFIPFVNLKLYHPHDFYPLVRSVHPDLIKKINQFLSPTALAVWEEKKELFLRLYNEKEVVADRLEKDIFQAYQIYFSAYCRMMKQNYLPAIIICQDIESASAVFRHYFAKCISDLSHKYAMLVIFISGNKDLPIKFTQIKLKKIEINPLSLDEIRNCFHILFPGLKVPPAAIRQIQKFSGGNYHSVLHFIYYLRLKDKIQKTNNQYSWIPQSQLSIRLPVNPLNLSWQLIQALKEEEKMVLYGLFLSHGILSPVKLMIFLELLGLNEKTSQSHLTYLKNTGLVSYAAENTPFNLKLRPLVKNSLGGKGNFVEHKFLEFLKEDIRSYLPYHALPLLRILPKLGDTTLLKTVVIGMLQYSMDTYSFPDSKILLDLAARQKGEQETWETITGGQNLRYLLLNRQIKEAQKFVANSIIKITPSFTANPYQADLHLQLARYFLTEKDSEKSINEAKKAALYFQELADPEKMSESYVELGQALLAKGSIPEALEYFEFARKFSTETGSALLNAKAHFLKALALFFIGNYTQVLGNLASGLKIAEVNGLRQFEQLFLFFNARTHFDLGLYENALAILQQCLAMDRLYTIEESVPTLKAWMARTYAYLGEYNSAHSLLDTLKETGENLLFRSEIFYLQKEYDKTSRLLLKAKHVRKRPCIFLAEHFSWDNGFAMIEDRRFDLTLHGSTLSRRIRCFEAYTSCFSDRLKEGLNELHSITIREKIPPFEPYNHIYYLFYYLILTRCQLPKDKDSELADSLTVLNLALKHLQERSTAIDDPKHRIHYISKNYWNKLLFQEAKQNRLL